MIAIDHLRAALKPADERELEYVAALERAAVAYAQRRSGKYLGDDVERTVYLRGRGTDRLYLEGPVAAVDVYDQPLPVTITERQYVGDEGTVLVEEDADGYVVRDNVVVRKGGLPFYDGYEYEVTYTRGGPAPEDIAQAVTQLVTLWFSKRIPLSRAGVEDEVPHGIRDILDSHRRPLC